MARGLSLSRRAVLLRACRRAAGLASFVAAIVCAGCSSASRQAARGRDAYAAHCASCHGEGGRGDGPSAAALWPKPRDLTHVEPKFGWVVDGLPRDEDLARIVRDGLADVMPPTPLPAGTMAALIAHVKRFDAEAWRTIPAGRPVTPPPDPWAGRAREARARGEAVYHGVAQCHACHPAYIPAEQVRALRGAEADVRADLHESRVFARKDGAGAGKGGIVAPDFTWHRLRSVREASRREDLYRVIAAGIPGAMPTWDGALATDDLWAMVWYVDSLVTRRVERAQQGDGLPLSDETVNSVPRP